MFEIKKPETSNKTFRLPVDLIQRLESVAQQNGVSMNYLVMECCEYALNNLKNDDKEDVEKSE